MAPDAPDFGSPPFAALRGASRFRPACVRHSFVQALGAGGADRAGFLHHLRQDHVFLHPCAAWSETWGGPDYRRVCETFAGLFEGAAAARLGSDPQAAARWPSLARTFETASRPEAGFWSLGAAPAA